MSGTATKTVLFVGAGLAQDAIAMADEAGIDLVTVHPTLTRPP